MASAIILGHAIYNVCRNKFSVRNSIYIVAFNVYVAFNLQSVLWLVDLNQDRFIALWQARCWQTIPSLRLYKPSCAPVRSVVLSES